VNNFSSGTASKRQGLMLFDGTHEFSTDLQKREVSAQRAVIIAGWGIFEHMFERAAKRQSSE
jgi:hypothetical protein